MSQNKNFTWIPIVPEKVEWLYSENEKDEERGCIGHLRGDFGRGDEFWTTWHPHQDELNKAPFRTELDDVVNIMRTKGGLLHSLSSMRNQCYQQDAAQLTTSYHSYGFQMETGNYQYYLRCSPVRDDYNFYLYCYDKNAQHEYVLNHVKAPYSRMNQNHDSGLDATIQSAEVRAAMQSASLPASKKEPEL